MNRGLPGYDAVASYDHIIAKAVHAEHHISFNLTQIGEVAQPGVATHLLVCGQEDGEVVSGAAGLEKRPQRSNQGGDGALAVGDPPAVDPPFFLYRLEGIGIPGTLRRDHIQMGIDDQGLVSTHIQVRL